MEITGRYIIKDKNTNEVVLDKENMIVMDGRLLLYSLFANKMFGDSNRTLDLKGIDINVSHNTDVTWYMFFGSGTGGTKINHTVSGINNGNLVSLDSSANTSVKVDLMLSATRPGIKIGYDLDGYSGQEVQYTEIAILMGVTENSETNYYTFSRVAMDPVVVTADTRFTIDYYIYF